MLPVLDFEDAVSVFAETVKLGVKYGVDLITIETMNDSYETKAALLAAKEHSDLPVLVSCAFGEDGKLMNYAFETFGYKAAGDEKEVVLNCGLINSDKYYPDGMTSENSLEIYINGKDIKRVNAALYEREKFDKNRDQYLEALGNSNLSEASLAQINGEGLSLVQSGLVPGTEYVLAVRAYNGYSEKDFIVSAKTSGEWDYRLAYYSSEDMQDQSKLASKVEANVMKFATEAGLDTAQLKNDMNGEVVARELANVRDTAQRFEINGTPFLIIGEQAFPGAIPYDQINSALD